jgi:hypothetical protein
VRAQYEHISMAVSGQPVLGRPALQTEKFLHLSWRFIMQLIVYSRSNMCNFNFLKSKAASQKCLEMAFFHFSFPLVLGFCHFDFFYKHSDINCSLFVPVPYQSVVLRRQNAPRSH